jgi:HK97 family phage major capsid protein
MINATGANFTLMGYPVVPDDNMPLIGPNSYSLGFGDFSRFYTIVDRMGTRVLRDPYSRKPYILFYTTRRVGGGIDDFHAAKFLRFSA